MTVAPADTDLQLAALAALLPEQPDADVFTDAGRLAEVLGLGLHDPAQVGPRVAALLEQVALDLDAPVALLNGVLTDVVVLAGAHGVDGWMAESRATPLEWSPCREVVSSGRPRVVTDLTADPGMRDSPLVTVDGLRAYAGVPVHARDGRVVGALCVIDAQPRDFAPDVVARLNAAAAAALVLLAVPAQGGPTS